MQNKKIKILFVCHGNICRSPMAEAIMKNIVNQNNLGDKLEIDSAATSTEAIGENIYPKAKLMLEANGINNFNHISRQITIKDYDYFNKIYVMDENNMRNILRMFGNDHEHKISKLLKNKDIEDPWYTDNFKKVFDEIKLGCEQILKENSTLKLT